MGWLAWGLGAATILLGIVATVVHGSQMSAAALPVRDWRAGDARRESHALGIPFPEADGTLSYPPRPPIGGVTGHDAALHLAMHLRRLAAEAGSNATSWPATIAESGHRPAHADPGAPAEHRAAAPGRHEADAPLAISLPEGWTLEMVLEEIRRQSGLR